MKKISIIVALADNNAIGKNNKLLCHIPADMKYFRRITTGHTVIMGKNTFLSVPGGPLKNRRNIVISDDRRDHFDGCETVHSIEEALGKCPDDLECFVIGGASVYRQFLPLASTLYLTRIYKSFEADTFFPEINPAEWEETSRIVADQDKKNDFRYVFIILRRKN